MPPLPHLPAEGTVPSPCISICRMDACTGWCEGCARNIDEIATWSVLSDFEKRSIWTELEKRRAAIAASADWLMPKGGF